MLSNLKIYTSYIDEENIKRITSQNLLPVFIIRSLGKINYLQQWAGSALHLIELSPSKELFWDFRDNRIDNQTFQKRFLIEKCLLDFQAIIEKLENLKNTCGADGIVLCGLGDITHRSLVSDILWRTGYLTEKPYEL